MKKWSRLTKILARMLCCLVVLGGVGLTMSGQVQAGYWSCPGSGGEIRWANNFLGATNANPDCSAQELAIMSNGEGSPRACTTDGSARCFRYFPPTYAATYKRMVSGSCIGYGLGTTTVIGLVSSSGAPGTAMECTWIAEPWKGVYISDTVPTSIRVGSSQSFGITMQNTGDNTWPSGSTIRMRYPDPAVGTEWNIVSNNVSASIAPGSQTTFTYNVTAPSVPGTYVMRQALVYEGVSWMPDTTPKLTKTITVYNTIPTISQSQPSGSPWRSAVSGYTDITVAGNVGDVDAQSITVQYQIDSGAWTNLTTLNTSTRSFNVPLNVGSYASGTHTIRVRAYDGYNYSTQTTGLTFQIDKTGPDAVTGTNSSIGANDWKNAANSILSSGDTQSGLYQIKYSTANNACASGTVGTSVALAEGTTTLYTCAIDNVRNQTATTLTYRIDLTPPICGTWSPATDTWSSGSTNFTLSGSTDILSGISVAGGTCTATGNGNTCNVTIYDNAGNSQVCTSPQNLVDTTAPTIIQTPSFAPDGNSSWYLTNPSITLAGTDLESGIEGIRYQWNTSFNAGDSSPAWTTTATETTFIPTTGNGGVHTLYYQALDKAGNYSTVESVVYRLNSNPQITLNNATQNHTLLPGGNLTFSGTFGDSDQGQMLNVYVEIKGVRVYIVSASTPAAYYQTWSKTFTYDDIMAYNPTPSDLTNLKFYVTDSAGVTAQVYYTGQISLNSTPTLTLDNPTTDYLLADPSQIGLPGFETATTSVKFTGTLGDADPSQQLNLKLELPSLVSGIPNLIKSVGPISTPATSSAWNIELTYQDLHVEDPTNPGTYIYPYGSSISNLTFELTDGVDPVTQLYSGVISLNQELNFTIWNGTQNQGAQVDLNDPINNPGTYLNFYGQITDLDPGKTLTLTASFSGISNPDTNDSNPLDLTYTYQTTFTSPLNQHFWSFSIPASYLGVGTYGSSSSPIPFILTDGVNTLVTYATGTLTITSPSTTDLTPDQINTLYSETLTTFAGAIYFPTGSTPNLIDPGTRAILSPATSPFNLQTDADQYFCYAPGCFEFSSTPLSQLWFKTINGLDYPFMVNFYDLPEEKDELRLLDTGW